MEKFDDLPSGQRIWELSERAVEIENSARKSDNLSYEVFAFEVNVAADRAMRSMDPVEQRFFAACFDGVYVPPEQRDRDWETEHEIRQELRRALYGKEEGVELAAYDPVEKTLASLSPEDEQVKYVFIMERDVLPRRKTELADVQLTSYGEFHAQGDIEYDLIAKVSAEGTTWGLQAQHYDFEDFADRGPRLVEVVHSFDSLEEAKVWMASDRTLVTPGQDSKDHLEKTVASPGAELRAAEKGLEGIIEHRRELLRDTSEDSYATRNELRVDIAQFGRFLHSVKNAEPGETLNLTQKIVDYGYDPEAATCDHMCGLEYESDFDRAKEVYESCILEISPIIENLEAAGIRMETGVISMAPPERDETMYDVEMEMER